MTRWRDCIGAECPETLLADTLRVALDSGAAKPWRMERVTVDTTVQTRAVAWPTDGHLMLRAVERLGALADRHGVTLRQSFARVARGARREAARLLHGRGHRQGLRHLRRLRTCPGRLIRDIGRKIAGNPELGEAGEAAFQWKDAPPNAFAETVARATQIHARKAGDRDKLHAFHAPEVECIGKGKARARVTSSA